MSGRIIDLTVTLTNNMPAHKFFPKPVIVPHFGHEEFRQWNSESRGINWAAPHVHRHG